MWIIISDVSLLAEHEFVDKIWLTYDNFEKNSVKEVIILKVSWKRDIIAALPNL